MKDQRQRTRAQNEARHNSHDIRVNLQLGDRHHGGHEDDQAGDQLAKRWREFNPGRLRRASYRVFRKLTERTAENKQEKRRHDVRKIAEKSSDRAGDSGQPQRIDRGPRKQEKHQEVGEPRDQR